VLACVATPQANNELEKTLKQLVSQQNAVSEAEARHQEAADKARQAKQDAERQQAALQALQEENKSTAEEIASKREHLEVRIASCGCFWLVSIPSCRLLFMTRRQRSKTLTASCQVWKLPNKSCKNYNRTLPRRERQGFASLRTLVSKLIVAFLNVTMQSMRK